MHKSFGLLEIMRFLKSLRDLWRGSLKVDLLSPVEGVNTQHTSLMITDHDVLHSIAGLTNAH